MKYLCLLHTPDGPPLDQASAEFADTVLQDAGVELIANT